MTKIAENNTRKPYIKRPVYVGGSIVLCLYDTRWISRWSITWKMMRWLSILSLVLSLLAADHAVSSGKIRKSDDIIMILHKTIKLILTLQYLFAKGSIAGDEKYFLRKYFETLMNAHTRFQFFYASFRKYNIVLLF